MRVWIIVGIGLAAIVTVLFLPPIPQDPAYHDFADRRPFLGIPNALNVLSNAPFVLVGALGLAFVRRRAALEERTALLILFAGVGLTGFGSAYYHLTPGNVTLFWDRLPMTIVFMSLFAVIIAERISLTAGRRLLPILLLAGAGSVAYWLVGELSGAGDLRPYALVQFFPLVAIPLILLLFPPRYTRGADLLGALAWYALAKLFEALDAQIFAVGGVVSGHTLKHLASAVAMYWILRMVRTRRAIRW
ncbi:MAG: ceramidase domain-containing protein [Candidatus Rokuibacteriota bacterium]